MSTRAEAARDQTPSGSVDDLIASTGRKSRLLLAVAEHRRRRETICFCFASLAAAASAALAAAAVLFAGRRTELLASAATLSLGACMIHSLVALGLDHAGSRTVDEGATKYLQLFDRARQLREEPDGSEYARKTLRSLSVEHALLSQQYDALLGGSGSDGPHAPGLDGPAPSESAGQSRYRQHPRIVPRKLHTRLSLDGGPTYPARLIDVSMSGASLAVAATLPAQAEVTVGRRKARVVRNHQKGIAVEFQQFLSPRTFNEDLVL